MPNEHYLDQHARIAFNQHTLLTAFYGDFPGWCNIANFQEIQWGIRIVRPIYNTTRVSIVLVVFVYWVIEVRPSTTVYHCPAATRPYIQGNMVITYSRVWINRVRLSILLVVSRTGNINNPLSPFAPENFVSRDGFSLSEYIYIILSRGRIIIHDSGWELVSRYSRLQGHTITYDIAPPYLVFDEYPDLSMCTLGSTFVFGRLLTSHVSPSCCTD